ncbi:unnamed protein product [Ostreobium quekettii]|uniref:BZIP domain-containing protein n=1 Tax=Ostreobium quekettii TaxID=121088 RepID=A0A8S1IQY7_9CHLO|nr:unnamed protein product [Ostreobium quekettii]|eukprot:evm.model.scf_1427.1 EVM.evm.TU.scf_1427.1   scf_1427:5100-5921(-)
MATDDKPTLEPFEGEDFEFPDFPDSLAALLLQDTCPSADLNEALKGFIEGECATSPGAGSSVNNDTLSNVEADSAGESACNGTGDGTQGGVPLSTLGRASSSSASSLASGLPARPVCQPSIRITTGIPGEQKAWAPVRTGMGPVAGYQGMDTQGHPYPHPFSTPTRLASSAAPAAPPPSNPEANEQAPAQVGKRRKPEPDLSKIEDPEERRRQRRLAKNRNTAAVSRQRKKAQLLSLEERVKQLEVDNSALKYWLAQRWAGCESGAALLRRGY